MRWFELWALTGLALLAGHMVRTMNLVRSVPRMTVIGKQGKVTEIGYPGDQPIYVKPVVHRSSA